MKIKDLKEPYKSLAIENQELQGNERNEEIKLSSLASEKGFDWGETPEGECFWDDVNEGEEPEVSIENEIIHNDFKTITSNLSELLEYKNKKYGESALNPINIFNGKTKVGQRLDDKISRIKNSDTLQKNDVADLMGYLVLVCQENSWTTFNEFMD